MKQKKQTVKEDTPSINLGDVYMIAQLYLKISVELPASKEREVMEKKARGIIKGIEDYNRKNKEKGS